MYSQNNEEKIILEYFNNKIDGKFLDIGAYDPFKFSNTRALVELGWSGVYVEPDPICMQNFRKQYATNSSIILVEKAVTDLTGRATLFSSGGDAVSSLDESHKIKWEAGSNVKFSPVEVETISLSSLLADHLENVDFLTIDVESTNLFLFDRLTDVVFESVKLICIEHDGHSDHIKNRCNNFGFKQLLLNGENIILGK